MVMHVIYFSKAFILIKNLLYLVVLAIKGNYFGIGFFFLQLNNRTVVGRMLPLPNILLIRQQRHKKVL